MSARNDFARELDGARKGAGMTIRDLAACAKTSYAYIHRVLNGQTCPSIETAERLAAATGLRLHVQLKRPPGQKLSQAG